MAQTLNNELLAGMLKNKRGKKGLRIIAQEIGGVSAATLSRIEQGKIPDVDTFIKICKWLEVPTDHFILGNKPPADSISNQEIILAHLRAEKELDPDTVEMIIRLVDLAYTKKK
jgi:transcriptional regulator with XRE-family HTH domain